MARLKDETLPLFKIIYMTSTTVEKHSFWADVSVEIEMNNDDFNLLCVHSKHHYDISVKGLTEYGGLLYGARNRRNFNPNDLGVTVSSKELQLLIKSLEMTRIHSCVAIYDRLFEILKELMDKRNEINETLKANK